MTKKYHTKTSAKKIMKREEKERMLEYEKLYPKKKPYPNAGVTEVRNKAKIVDKSSYDGSTYDGGRSWVTKTYKKGNYQYLITLQKKKGSKENEEILVFYLPSKKRKLKIMFEWNSKAQKWKLLMHRKGDW